MPAHLLIFFLLELWSATGYNLWIMPHIADLCGLIEIANHATDNELPTRTFEETVFKQKFGSKHLPVFAGV